MLISVSFTGPGRTLRPAGFSAVKQVLDVLLFKNSYHRFAGRRIVDVGTGKQLIDDIVHFGISQHLSLWDGSISGKTECQSTVDILLHTRTAVHG